MKFLEHKQLIHSFFHFVRKATTLAHAIANNSRTGQSFNQEANKEINML